MRAFVEAVFEGEDLPVTGADGRAATEIALAACRSIETGTSVALLHEE